MLADAVGIDSFNIAEHSRQDMMDSARYPPLKVGMHSHGFVARTDREAVDIQWPHWAHVFENAAAERGWARPTMDRFQAEVDEGSLYLGSVDGRDGRTVPSRGDSTGQGAAEGPGP